MITAELRAACSAAANDVAAALWDHQREAARGVAAAWPKSARKSVLLVSPTGCHRAGQLVMMHDGSLRAVENVREGECLMGPDSTPRRVLRLCRGRMHPRRWCKPCITWASALR